MVEKMDLVAILRDAEYRGRFSLAERSYERKDLVFRQDEEPGGIHVIVSGLVKSCMLAENGKETLIALSGPGDALGELEFFLGKRIACSVTALESTTTLYASNGLLERSLSVSPDLSVALARILAGKLYRSSLRMQTHLVFPLEYNLLKAILTRLDLSLPERRAVLKSELAEYLGCTERHLNRVYGDLSSRGIISVSAAGVHDIDRSKANAVMREIEGGNSGT